MSSILLLNGPNLNRLGSREPARYGRTSLADISKRIELLCGNAGVGFDHFQSNAEHAMIDRIHLAGDDNVNGIIINPAAWTHTSIALRDALLSVERPFVEVHLSNIHARESFRQHSYFSDIAIGTIVGLGALGYELALIALLNHLGVQHTLTLPPA